MSHGRIFVISHVGREQEQCADDLFELFGEDLLDYVDDLAEDMQKEEKKRFMSTLAKAVDGHVSGDADSFALDGDAALAYSKLLLPEVKEFFEKLTPEQFQDSFYGLYRAKQILEPYKEIYVVDPCGEPMSLDKFVRQPMDSPLYIEAVFDYHF